MQRTILYRNDHAKSYNIAPGCNLVGDVPTFLDQEFLNEKKYDRFLRPDSFLVNCKKPLHRFKFVNQVFIMRRPYLTRKFQ